MIEFELPFPPTLNHACGRKGNKSYLTQEQKDYRKAVAGALAWGELHDADSPLATLEFPLPGRLAVALRFYEPDRRKRDLDNLPKAVLDALTHAGLWVDDAQIDCLMLARIGVSTDRPCVVVRVWRYVPSELDLPFMEAVLASSNRSSSEMPRCKDKL